MTPFPGPVSVTYGRVLVNGALANVWLNAPTEITPG